MMKTQMIYKFPLFITVDLNASKCQIFTQEQYNHEDIGSATWNNNVMVTITLDNWTFIIEHTFTEF